MKLFRKILQLCILGLIIVSFSYIMNYHRQTSVNVKFSQTLEQIMMTKTENSSPMLVAEKLSRLKMETYYGFPGQSNCRKICHDVLGVPRYMVSSLKPVGNYTDLPTLGINHDGVFQYILPQLQGGSWAYKIENQDSPDQCSTVQPEGVAVVIVCKNRWKQLYFTLATLIPLLQRQHLCYRIFVIEQSESGPLNKAKLLNIGFMEAAERFHFKCVIFQDADVAPINDLNPYACDKQTEETVVHLGVALDSLNFKLQYPKLIGGALKISNRHFVTVNGYSNSYWGWGQEDDDLERRLTYSGIKYIHMGVDVARYMAVPHDPQTRVYVTDHRRLLKKAHERISYDGLNSLDYEIISVNEEPLYTHILVSVGPPPRSYV